MDTDRGREWDAHPPDRSRLSPILRRVALGAAGALMAVGLLTVLMIATYPGSCIDRNPRNWPVLGPEAGGVPVPPPPLDPDDGCAGREALCATVATDDPGATLQRLGAAWRQGEAKRFRLRVTVAPEE